MADREAWGQTPGGKAQRVALMPEALRRAMDEALARRSRPADLTDPREREWLALDALKALGYVEVHADLTRGGRPPAGSMSRGERRDWMAAHDDPVLRYAVTLLPAARKARNPSKRAQSDVLPQRELARLLRWKMREEGLTEVDAAKALADTLDGGYSEYDIRKALVRERDK